MNPGIPGDALRFDRSHALTNPIDYATRPQNWWTRVSAFHRGWELTGICTIALVIALTTFSVAHRIGRPKKDDWDVYYEAGEAMRARMPIYTTDNDIYLTFKNAPVVALMAIPVASMPRPVARLVWYFGDLLVLGGLVVLMARLVFPPHTPPRASAWLACAALALGERYVSYQLRCGKTTTLYVLLTVLAFYLCTRPHAGIVAIGLSGAALALAVCLKVVPVCVAPYYLMVRRGWIAIVSFALASVALLIVPAAWVGWDANLDLLRQWPEHLRATENNNQIVRIENQSIYAELARMFGPTSADNTLLPRSELSSAHWPVLSDRPAVQHVWLAASIFAAAALYVLLRRTSGLRSRDPHARDAMHLSFLFIFMTLFNPLAWRYNFLALLVPYAFIAYGLWQFPAGRKVRAGLLAAAYLIQSIPDGIEAAPWLDWIPVFGGRLWGTTLLALCVWMTYRAAERSAITRIQRFLLGESGISTFTSLPPGAAFR